MLSLATFSQSLLITSLTQFTLDNRLLMSLTTALSYINIFVCLISVNVYSGLLSHSRNKMLSEHCLVAEREEEKKHIVVALLQLLSQKMYVVNQITTSVIVFDCCFIKEEYP